MKKKKSCIFPVNEGNQKNRKPKPGGRGGVEGAKQEFNNVQLVSKL